jgi:hypothetical protein
MIIPLTSAPVSHEVPGSIPGGVIYLGPEDWSSGCRIVPIFTFYYYRIDNRIYLVYTARMRLKSPFTPAV